jgi:hypothetical protein
MESIRNQPSREQLLLMERFTELYNAPPLDGYISFFALSTVGAESADSPESERADACIVVRLREPLPREVEIPAEFEGVKVFAKI